MLFIAFILVPDPGKASKSDNAEVINAKMTVHDWLSIVTNPRTWMAGIAVFATYTMY